MKFKFSATHVRRPNWFPRGHELNNLRRQLMPHDRSLANQTFHLLRANMATRPDGLRSSCRRHHALQQPTNILAHWRVDSLMLLDIVQLHLSKENVEHEDAACQVVFRVSWELWRRSRRRCLLVVGDCWIRYRFVFYDRRWWMRWEISFKLTKFENIELTDRATSWLG